MRLCTPLYEPGSTLQSRAITYRNVDVAQTPLQRARKTAGELTRKQGNDRVRRRAPTRVVGLEEPHHGPVTRGGRCIGCAAFESRIARNSLRYQVQPSPRGKQLCHRRVSGMLSGRVVPQRSRSYMCTVTYHLSLRGTHLRHCSISGMLSGHAVPQRSRSYMCTVTYNLSLRGTHLRHCSISGMLSGHEVPQRSRSYMCTVTYNLSLRGTHLRHRSIPGMLSGHAVPQRHCSYVCSDTYKPSLRGTHLRCRSGSARTLSTELKAVDCCQNVSNPTCVPSPFNGSRLSRAAHTAEPFARRNNFFSTAAPIVADSRSTLASWTMEVTAHEPAPPRSCRGQISGYLLDTFVLFGGGMVEGVRVAEGKGGKKRRIGGRGSQKWEEPTAIFYPEEEETMIERRNGVVVDSIRTCTFSDLLHEALVTGLVSDWLLDTAKDFQSAGSPVADRQYSFVDVPVMSRVARSSLRIGTMRINDTQRGKRKYAIRLMDRDDPFNLYIADVPLLEQTLSVQIGYLSDDWSPSSAEPEEKLITIREACKNINVKFATLVRHLNAFKASGTENIKYEANYYITKVISETTFKKASSSRETSFNKTNVGMYFDNLEDVHKCFGSFPSERIWNQDEIGITTVQNPSKMVALKGAKQVGSVTSSERNMGSWYRCPPMESHTPNYGNFKEFMLKGACEGIIDGANPYDWFNEELHLKFMEHFIKRTKPTREEHLASEARVVIFTFPPHTSHKLQPLNRAVYFPFKAYYYQGVEVLLINNRGKTVDFYTFTLSNITSGIKKLGIFPLDRGVFNNNDYLPSYVTDHPASNSVKVTSHSGEDKSSSSKRNERNSFEKSILGPSKSASESSPVSRVQNENVDLKMALSASCEKSEARALWWRFCPAAGRRRLLTGFLCLSRSFSLFLSLSLSHPLPLLRIPVIQIPEFVSPAKKQIRGQAILFHPVRSTLVSAFVHFVYPDVALPLAANGMLL
ncbi:hypothetical protein PR048_024918 [Dryococelus australis]|uniref:DDE-1 domain-containing protein n=1 Tax=Dryococelus australis TaxID=614101 RepID=A0ABQ9GPW1_9NEOP|nr:hypothetical protein PR048_024918 [Dryococelus australis]